MPEPPPTTSTITGMDILTQRKDQVMQNLTAKWKSDEMTQRREQMKQGFQSFSSRIQQGSHDLGARIQTKGQEVLTEERKQQMAEKGTQVKHGLQSISSKLQQGSQDLGARIQTKSQDVLTEERRLQMKHGLQKVGNTLQQLVIDPTQRKNQEGLNSQLAMFNERMKEEAMRRDVRREAEQACLDTMRTHLTDFLASPETAKGTYEDWIEAFHPENTQDLTLLQDMEYKEVDIRFYVKESDHLQLWNEFVQDPQRQVQPRARMFAGPTVQGKDPGSSSVDPFQPPNAPLLVDLLGEGNPPPTPVATSSQTLDLFGGEDPFAATTPTAVPTNHDDTEYETVDFLI